MRLWLVSVTILFWIFCAPFELMLQGAAGATRHKGKLGELAFPLTPSAQPGPKPQPSKPHPKTGQVDPKSAASTPEPPPSNWIGPKLSGPCRFSAAQDFNLKRILDWKSRDERQFFFVVENQLDRPGTRYLYEAKLPRTGQGPALFSTAKRSLDVPIVRFSLGDTLEAALSEQGLHLRRAETDWKPGFTKEQWTDAFVTPSDKLWGVQHTDGKFVLTLLNPSQGTTTLLPFHSTSPFSIADVATDGERVLLIKNLSTTRSELWQFHVNTSSKLWEGGHLTAALYTADGLHVLFVDRAGADSASTLQRLEWNGTESRHSPLHSRPFPVESVSFSRQRDRLAIVYNDWGLTSSTLVSMDPAGTPIEFAPLSTERAQGTRSVRPLPNKALAQRAISVLSSPESADRLVLFEGSQHRDLFIQGEDSGCVSRWFRQDVSVPVDDAARTFAVDVFEPFPKVSNRKAILHFPDLPAHPHTPAFEAVRQYWLQSGWTVVEPHLGGSWERGLNHFLFGAATFTAPSLEQTVQTVQAALKFTPNSWLFISESDSGVADLRRKEGPLKQVFAREDFQCARDTQPVPCSSQQLARRALASTESK